MNDDLIKPDANKPVVPDTNRDIPSITPEPATPEASDTDLAPSVAEPASSPAATVSDSIATPETVAQPTQPTEIKPTATASSSFAPPHAPVVPDDKHPKTGLRLWLWVALAVVIVLLIAGGAYAAYKIGNNRGYKNGKAAATNAMAATMIKIPQNATMVAQCAVGEGTQYVRPSDIPQGPIYNVWNNKVTGVEFMLAQSKIAANKTLDLALKNQKYDHIDVMYEAAGHAGFTEPHYHIVLSMLSYADEQKITCDANSASHSSHDMSSMDM